MMAEAPLSNEITVRDNPEARRFEAAIDGQVAFAEYNRLSTGIVLAHTVGLGRRQRDLKTVSRGATVQRRLEAADDTAVAVQVTQRRARMGILERVAVGIAETIVEGDDVVVGNVHAGVFRDGVAG